MEAAVCPALTFVICTPAIWQRVWEAEFIRTLRSDGGDSAYVPTTVVYSSFDEIVEPMTRPNASALLGDARGVGVNQRPISRPSALASLLGGSIHMRAFYITPLRGLWPLTPSRMMDRLVSPGWTWLACVDRPWRRSWSAPRD